MKEIIQVVHDAEVIDFFRSIGLAEEFQEGRLSCMICAEPLTTTSFCAAAKLLGRTVFSCNKPSCYIQFILRSRE